MVQHDDSRRSRKLFSTSVLPFTISARHLSWRPTRFGLVFALLVTGILAGAVNYANNLGFLLGFLLGAVGGVSLFHGYGNLTALTLAAVRAEPVFAGEEANFELFTRADGSGVTAVRFALGRQPASTAPTDLSSGCCDHDSDPGSGTSTRTARPRWGGDRLRIPSRSLQIFLSSSARPDVFGVPQAGGRREYADSPFSRP